MLTLPSVWDISELTAQRTNKCNALYILTDPSQPIWPNYHGKLKDSFKRWLRRRYLVQRTSTVKLIVCKLCSAHMEDNLEKMSTNTSWSINSYWMNAAKIPKRNIITSGWVGLANETNTYTLLELAAWLQDCFEMKMEYKVHV